MGEITIKTNKFNRTARFSTSSPIWKIANILPYLLFIAFAWQNVYSVLSTYGANAVVGGNTVAYIILDIILFSAIDYLVLLFWLWIYRSILETKIYFFLTSKRTFNTTFKFWVLIKTLIMGGLYFALFWCPWIEFYMPVIEMVFSFLVVICTFYSLREHIGVLFRHLYFKSLLWPWFIYQFLGILLQLLLGGL